MSVSTYASSSYSSRRVPSSSTPTSSSITLPPPDELARGFGSDLLLPQDFVPHAPPIGADNIDIAPWLEDPPPTPPPKPQRYNLPHKPSLPSFNVSRHHSGSSLSLATVRNDTSSTHSGPSYLDSHPHGEPRPPKSKLSVSSMYKAIRGKRSASRLRSAEQSLPDEPIPPLPSSTSFPDPPNGLSPSTSTSTTKFIPKRRPKPKASRPSAEAPVSTTPDSEFKLDTNIANMSGIVDESRLPSYPDSGSPRSNGFDHSGSSDVSSVNQSLGTSSGMFTNPFHAPTQVNRSLVPPTTSFDGRSIPPNTRPPDFIGDESRSWFPPESWAVDKEEEHPIVDESESDDNEHRMSIIGRRGRKTKPITYKIRIYRANGTYHVVSIDMSVTVDKLTPELNKKLLLDPEREPHRLYLKERGRERVLAPSEKPARIMRRRLEQAGYTDIDGLENLGAEDLAFLMRFVYKSNVLGPTTDDLHINTFDLIDLTGRSMRTVPVLLYAHADAIVLLNLSRNPMLEIPLDFLEACTTLRELRLSHMAMKKVPHSVRHCRTLHRLDLSCNRIADLDDAGLDWIPELRSLKVQNNRMEKLPWYFPRLRALRDLNISNNKFRELPSVVTEITSLVDLDISFNMIDKLPDTIGRLRALERFIIVGNNVSKFPASCSDLVDLRTLDCRRNHISDLSMICMLPKIQQISADHNAVHALDLSFGPCLEELVASHNDITQLTLIPGPLGQPYALTSLDISHAKLSALDERALAQLSALEKLRFDHNSIRYIPDSLGSLTRLTHLSCSNNQLRALPVTIGNLQRLVSLEAHNNSLDELPGTLWNCPSLQLINVTSNLVGSWRLPPAHALGVNRRVLPERNGSLSTLTSDRKPSTTTSSMSQSWPPLAGSLERLYLGENRLTDDALLPLTLLKELRVLNLSFNEIQEMPATFFGNLTHLRELYLSGNKLSAIPTEDLQRLTKLEVFFLNGNKLQNLPKELGKLTSLAVLDVGSNALRYNICNWEYDWNWNFNKNLQYLNLSGNERLEIRTDVAPIKDDEKRRVLADFSGLSRLRILGLMDITLTHIAAIPDESEDRRVRTSSSEVNGMGYGIADTLGVTEHLNMLDLVQPRFRGHNDEAVFAMFGRASHIGNNHWLNSYLQSHFPDVYSEELSRLRHEKHEEIPDALRRAFLKLNKRLHDYLYSSSNRKMSHVSTSTQNGIRDLVNPRSGASGIVVHLVGRTLFVANAGRSLAVISRQGTATLLSRKHDPFDREETARIRAAEGWVSPKGLVNEEIDVARSFGFYNLLPVVNARPDVCRWDLNEQDEFIIIANPGLWDNVSYQTAVDIARTESRDPMIAAQKLRDLAISHGAEGTTMIMVIAVADLFMGRSRQPFPRTKLGPPITDKDISRLDGEVPPPTGHLALVFTDIRNSTHLWEVNAGMPTALVLHNNLLRRLLRICGGYEVKTEGDAFVCSFPTALSALWWCLSVQVQLLQVDWPLEILECEDGKEIHDPDGNFIARGLSVRMGIHSGQPVCEPDPITKRMDYFGSMVNRSARISGSAAGGQIMCSADVVREINARILETEPETEQSHLQPPQAIEGIRALGVVVVPVGEVKLKGLEVPEVLSLVYPKALVGRQQLNANAQTESNPSGSRVQFSIEQMRELALLCLRLEALSSGKVLRLTSSSRASSSDHGGECSETSGIVHCDPKTLLPAMDKASDAELMILLDSLTTRIDNALTRVSLNRLCATMNPRAPLSGHSQDWLNQLLSVVCANSLLCPRH